MDGFEPLGRWLLALGLVITCIGLSLIVVPRVPFLGHLPGDLTIQRDGLTIYIPLASMLLISVVVSLILSLIGRR